MIDTWVENFLRFFETPIKLERLLDHDISMSTFDLNEPTSPWHFWTLLCLARHHVRQNWVARIVKFRLNGDLGALSIAGAFAHPDIPRSGLVPGDTEWKYYFHGIGCCLTHRGTGESIDVDFFDDTGDYFELYFYFNFLESLRKPEFPEKRLINLHPSFVSTGIAIDQFRESKAFIKHPEERAFKLSPEVISCLPNIEIFCDALENSDHVAKLASLIGDWQLVQASLEETNDSVTLPQVVALANASRTLRLESAKSLYEQERERRVALAAIQEVSPDQAEEFIRSTLQGPPSGAVSFALDSIHESNDERYCEDVFKLFLSVDPNNALPEPHIWASCASFLLKHDYQKSKVLHSFKCVTSRKSAEAALLSLKFDPKQARRLFRLALRSPIPIERIEGSAMLAIIDRPWSRNELAEILTEFDDEAMTIYARAALAASRHPEDHQLVEEWEAAHPRKGETGEFITFEEMSIRNRDSTINHKMQELHDRVWPLRDREV